MEDFTEAAFATLDKNLLVEIMKRMDPQSVLDLCSSTERMADVCTDPSVMRALFAHHYPGVPIKDDPAQQFRKLSQTKIKVWYFYVDRDTNKVTWVTLIPDGRVDLDRYDMYRIEIRAEVRIPPDTQLFVTVEGSGMERGETQLFF